MVFLTEYDILINHINSELHIKNLNNILRHKLSYKILIKPDIWILVL